ncbi:MAG: bifunctional folylpolyglutamate synthase/dihydrofolate synthase, partial [Candidatus Tectomicrobia bacterium]|nr:bifunctional folylpolyglutamate synthase/dihydrofolate synthase [Candidatus Tectomicrobia bacterium]
MSYPEILEYIYSLQKFGIKLGLQNMRCFLDLLGHPERDFPSIHIAGTKGKGSTAAMVASILSAHGYRVGLYTSPHLQSFTERFSINGRAISQERVCGIARELQALLDRELHDKPGGGDTLFLQSITYFEFVTAMAFRYFSTEKVDVAVVEVGLGGRLDATNVVDPLLSVITNIDYEHTQYLGETLEAIAREKGGIIKKGRPVVSGVVQSGPAQVIEEISRVREAPLDLLDRDFGAVSVLETPFVQYLDYRETGRGPLVNLRLPLLGVHQQWNAALALRVCSILPALGFSLTESGLRDGLASTRWPGRLQVVRYRPVLIVDGA